MAHVWQGFTYESNNPGKKKRPIDNWPQKPLNPLGGDIH